MNYPLRLNMGCGRDLREDYLNLDFEPTWGPDVTFDLNQPFFSTGSCKFKTTRFGEIEIVPGTFELILAYDVLEHLPNLVTAMTSCLQLLRPGGVLDIYVPYDLSVSAWQDPTHVRAFNENSWLYYTDDFWRLGWREAKFSLTRYAAVLTEYGQELQSQGMPLKQIARMPRAISHMKVLLQKTVLSPEEKNRFNKNTDHM